MEGLHEEVGDELADLPADLAVHVLGRDLHIGIAIHHLANTTR